MPFGRYFQGLTAFDLLGNLVPGLTVTIFAIGFLPDSPYPTEIGGFGLFILSAYILGVLLQRHASLAFGDRNHFDKTMEGVETLSSAKHTDEENNPSEGGSSGSQDVQVNDGKLEGICNRMRSPHWENIPHWPAIHPILGPIIGMKRPPRGCELEDKILANRIWEHLIDAYTIPFETESYSPLYHLMLSKIDNIESPSRAIRLQALRNFHRGMWIAF